MLGVKRPLHARGSKHSFHGRRRSVICVLGLHALSVIWSPAGNQVISTLCHSTAQTQRYRQDMQYECHRKTRNLS